MVASHEGLAQAGVEGQNSIRRKPLVGLVAEGSPELMPAGDLKSGCRAR